MVSSIVSLWVLSWFIWKTINPNTRFQYPITILELPENLKRI